MDAAAEIWENPVSKHHIKPECWRMSRLKRDGTAELVSRDQILRRERGQGNMFIFPFQLTTSRIDSLTWLIHTLLYVMTTHTYIHAYCQCTNKKWMRGKCTIRCSNYLEDYCTCTGELSAVNAVGTQNCVTLNSIATSPMAGDGTIVGRRRKKRKESRAEAPDSARALRMRGLTRDGMVESVSRDQNSTLEVIRSNTLSDHAPSHTDQHRGGHTLPSSRAFSCACTYRCEPHGKIR